MQLFKRANNLAGAGIFLIAALTYWLTMEPTVSFWDCGEFLAASYKMEVGHQPGAPLYLMIGKLFSLLSFGNTAKVAYWINFLSVFASAATVMLLFWTINAIGLKITGKAAESPSRTETASIIFAGAVGALAFAFSDTFWFSAVEAEVYALSMLFTALVFWAILKWENSSNDRWLIFIAFLIGLSIGVHLLSLLAIPAVTLVWYFKKAERPQFWGVARALLLALLLLGLVQVGIVQYLVLLAARTDIFFVNTLNLGFGTGAVVFLLAVVASLAAALYHSVKRKKYALNLGLLCLTFILFGYSSYFMILIRAQAQPNVNLSNPEHPLALHEYLGRTQYEEKPLIYGQYFDAAVTGSKITGKLYRKGDERYEVAGETFKTEYDRNGVFPRVYSSRPDHIQFYRSWLGLSENQQPQVADNLKFFSSYQLGFMYWRYFLWNFSGRQNDEQGQGSAIEGNWITGIKPVDALRLGSQNNLPPSLAENEGRNTYFALPFLLGIAGAIYVFRRNRQQALVIGTLFICTGVAIIVYLNQDPLQVRERDYAYVGSFYAFCMFIGIGSFAVRNLFAKLMPAKLSPVLSGLACLTSVPLLMVCQGWNDHNRTGKTTALDWAKNYLNSCAPNAILITNADNDTFPLWYAQEVEGIRTDVRVVNRQFLSDPSYISQMRRWSNRSAPLPMALPHKKIVAGVRDYFPYVDYGLKDSVELSDLLAVMSSDHTEDQVQMNDGSFMNFLPTRRFSLQVDPEQVVQTGTFHDRSQVTTKMEWEFNGKFAGKADLAMIDLLVHNNWKRPVYFSTSVSNDTYLGLDKYLYLEGYAFRLLPLKAGETDQKQKEERTNDTPMYKNLTSRFSLAGFKTASYLDPESRRVASGAWNLYNTLAANLLRDGKKAQASTVLRTALKGLPLRNRSIADTLGKLLLVENLRKADQHAEATKITDETAAFLEKELDWIARKEPEGQQRFVSDIQRGMYVLNGLARVCTLHGDRTRAENIEKIFGRLEAVFQRNLG
ncbi:DUF2723 domain-containing protein [Pedobacter yulinensis]|uniref:DUF2723 domain-containing protein n=1 Tax=Pedobacter yulinensis TaxID=2126353 RepID=A0A2T3HKC4_9SPHI|nr:DUF2723 domain-containing protein [Pedobacter yulinensis]PST82905.1 DUF2723 domain-containing protein [Pedobacter yulinensis]